MDETTNDQNPRPETHGERTVTEEAGSDSDDGVPDTNRTESGLRLVVGIGASAGGRESLQQFFRDAPSDAGIAYVVVQHLSPDMDNLMDELLRRCTSMPVAVAAEGDELAPNHVYLIPPRTDMSLVDGRLHLEDAKTSRGTPVPIDSFFRSMAEARGPRCAAVIVSGTGSDGSRGIQLVKEAGGLVLVQDPEEARFNGMPRSALLTGCADFVLGVSLMAGRLEAFVKDPGGVDVIERMRSELSAGQSPLESIHAMLLRESGIDFRNYKPGTLMRRTCRRMAAHRIGELNEYIELLRADPEERIRLLKDYLIGVTEFFRDHEAFEALRDQVLADLVERSQPQGIRVWVAGCSTGEEAYSIAMLLEDLVAARGEPVPFKVYATDIDQAAIERAGSGRYSHGAAEGLPGEVFQRYFHETPDGYEVSRELRERIVFATHDAVKDPPFTRMDLVVCRNMLIYLKPDVQDHVLRGFHFSIRDKGYLMLGPSEVLPADVGEEFDEVSGRWRLFRKHRDVRLPRSQQDRLSSGVVAVPRSLRSAGPALGSTGAAGMDVYTVDAYTLALDALVKDQWAAALLVNPRFAVVHSFGDASSFCRAPSGKATLEVARMLPEQARLITVSALHRCARLGKRARHADVPFDFDYDSFTADLDVVPLRPKRGGAPHFLIGFGESRHPQPPPEMVDMDSEQRTYIQRLEDDLQKTKESLQATVEELETANEELQSTNEELLASNEELQSTNEELHSVNEELYTVNLEHQTKIGELTSVTADLENLLQVTEVGTLFIDEELNIRRFTEKAAEFLGLLEHDVGRSLKLFASRLEGVDLTAICAEVARTDEPEECATVTTDGIPLLLRVSPFNRESDHFEGLVVTLNDISEVTRAQQQVVESELRLRQITDRLDIVVWMTLPDGTVEYASPAFGQIFGFSPEELYANSRAWIEAIHPEDIGRVTKEWMAQFEGEEFDTEFRILRPDGEVRWLHDTSEWILDDDGKIERITGVARDITALKRWEAEVEQVNRELAEQACLDSLTGLANRRGVDAFLGAHMKSAASTGATMSVALVDLDDFKGVNDSLGHATGDVVLQQLAQAMKRSVRPTDLVARVGGDEFLVLFPEARIAEAYTVAERMRRALKETLGESGGQQITVSASIGISAIPPGAVSIDEILLRTEDALSNGKRSGKAAW